MKSTILFLLAPGALGLTQPTQLIPQLGGPFAVSNVVLPLTDTSRRDPYNTTQARRVLLSLYLPAPRSAACNPQNVPYMTPAVTAWYNQYVASFGLPGNLFDHLGLQFCESVQQSGRKCREHFPVVLYSPGSGNSRLIYGARARSLASQGYMVVTVDHPYDAAVVEFPDGSIVLGADIDDSDETQLAKAVAVRAADLSFVVSQLNNKPLIDALLSAHPARPNTRKVLAIGHSLGGTASFAAANNDSRIHGAINFDGQFVEPFQSQPYRKPGMLVGRPDHEASDPTWDATWPYLRGKKAELHINGTQHGTFEDFPTLIPLFNLPDAAKQALVPLLGTISWQDMDRDMNSAVAVFVDLVFRGEARPLAEIETKYPNITIVRSDI